MIIQKHKRQITAIRQEDHAAFAAFLLEHWLDHGFPHHPDREAIIRATREHDNGWHQFDAQPRLDAKTKLPVDFQRVTPEETFQIWMEGTARFAETDPLVALLITHHAYTLHEHIHRRTGIWQEFFVGLAKRRGALRDSLGLQHNDIERLYSYLRMADLLSLQFCMNRTLGAERPERYAGYAYRRDANQFQFRPYPFTSRRLTYALPTYPLERTGYNDVSELQAAMQKPVIEEITIAPLERWDE
ncbi:MAG: DUF3891 family protein [Armatimonadetes bacterium]|nr:DUF3891 family protein [Armatimonadota bacterium]